jgi:hypothetical protein
MRIIFMINEFMINSFDDSKDWVTFGLFYKKGYILTRSLVNYG